MMSKKWRFSRSHVEADTECKRKLYHGYYAEGTGLTPAGFNLDTETGQAVHDILGGVLCGRDFDSQLVERLQKYAEEAEEGNVDIFEIRRQLALIEGLARLWVKHRLPFFTEHFRVIAVEEELNIPLGDSNLELMSRVDVKLQRIIDGGFFAGPEFKTTSYLTDEFLEGWRYSIQTMTHSLDMEYMVGEPPFGVIMEFLYKGYRKRGKDGKHEYFSPILMGRRKAGKTFDKTNLGWNGTGEKFNSWEEVSMKEWVELMPLEVQQAQLATRIINRNEDEVGEWVEQTTIRQLEVSKAIEALDYEPGNTSLLRKVFPANLNTSCYSNKYHRKCEFLEVCFGEIQDPLGSGRYQRRVPHHPMEFKGDEE
jgi:PD-(D/E)XK nuclease superfamily protein